MRERRVTTPGSKDRNGASAKVTGRSGSESRHGGVLTCRLSGRTVDSLISMQNEDLTNRKIAGYQLLERVGEGGTATVYRAPHAERGVCAVKVLRAKLRGDRTAVQRFLREAAFGARIKHVHVGATYDYGEAEGLHYLALE